MGCCCQCSKPPAPKQGPARDWFVFGLLAMLAGVVMTVSLAVNLTPPEGHARTVVHSVLALLTLGALSAFARPIFESAARFRITLESLFLVGLIGAFAASVYSSVTGIGHIYYEVTLILLAIYRLGQLISAHQLSNAQNFARNIPGMADKARRLREGEITTVSIQEIAAGDVIVIRPEETIPVDGTVSRGRAYIEQLPHTGEPFPVPKHPGDSVLAGTSVLDGEIEVTASSSGTAREIDRLCSSLEAGQPSQTEGLAREILRFFVPAVVFTAFLTLIGWGLIANDWQAAIFHALAVTIVACPCGLGLAIPLAVRNGNFQLRLLGIVPQCGQLLERLAGIDTIVFDKTGTLTESSLSLAELKINAEAPLELKSWLAEIQRRSTHPVARPFWGLAEPAILENLEIDNLPARGIRATFSWLSEPQTLVIGNQLFVEETTGKKLQSVSRQVDIFLNEEHIAHAKLGEDSRATSRSALRSLKESGYRIEIMTGDVSVDSAFSELADSTHTSLTIQQKGELVLERQHSGHHVLYIGDGLNDAEAMQAAEASLALGIGNAVANEVADGRLDPPDLSVVPRAIALAKNVRRRLVALLYFVLIYNFVGLVLAVSGWLHPVVAAVLMLASSITVLSQVSRRVSG